MKHAKKKTTKCRVTRHRKPKPELVIAAQALMPATPLAMVRSPKRVLEEAIEAAQALKLVLDQRPKKVMIKGQRYLCYDDWQTVARFFGITAKPTKTVHVTIGQHHGFKAYADALLVATGQVISGAAAMCLTDEPKWALKPVYQEGEDGRRVHTHDELVPHFQRLSMAQTRACAKAIRNVCSWVVVLAGFQPTPAEEMDGFNQDVGYGACGRCGEDMYFKDEGKHGICRTCQGKYEKPTGALVEDLKRSVAAAVKTRREQFTAQTQ